jgi:hypothetical protein
VALASLVLFLIVGCAAAPPRADDPLSMPRLSFVRMIGPISVWIVDGAYVRTTIDEEFTNFGFHASSSAIPLNEFWLDKEAVPDEQEFFLRNLVVEEDRIARGASFESALAAGDSAERVERLRAGDAASITPAGRLPDPERMHEILWKTLESGVHVWIVNGRLVRSVFDVDFTEGGHEHVYEFVPENEVWIDDDVQEAERPDVLFHELHERNLMAGGEAYDAAHEASSRLESFYRHHPEELHAALAKEGWE